jgi:aminoglycoside phosphotransferase
MDPDVKSLLVSCTGADRIEAAGSIQSLWSGYGSIDRYRLDGTAPSSIIVKHVRFPDTDAASAHHPRSWGGNRSDRRKRQSYEVETHWYLHWAMQCDAACRVPHCLAVESHDDQVLIVLEDLAASGFSVVKRQVSPAEIRLCLSWLAHFHAQFMHQAPTGLWPVGTYWHLATRPDELRAMADDRLRNAAAWLDSTLSEAPYPTLVHGDAKLANFLFSPIGQAVAAVDFQYVGGGCAMKDLAYFVSSCLDEHACEEHETRFLDDYFSALKSALRQRRPDIPDVDDVERSLRPLYPVAWTDFYRFLKGWSPGHWKIHSYSERLAREVLESIPV